MRKLLSMALLCALTLVSGMASAASFTSEATATATKDLPFIFTITSDSTNPITIDNTTLDGVVGLPAGFEFVGGVGSATISGSANQTGAWTIHLTTGDATQDLFLAVLNPNSNSNRPKLGSFTALPNPVSIGSTVQYTSTGTDDDGDHLAFYWDFGDGVGTSRLQNPTYAYTAAGTYTISLTISDGQKIVGKTQNIVVAANAIAGSTLQIAKAKIQFFFPTSKAAQSRVQLTGTCAAPTTVTTASWIVGDPASSGITFAAAVSRSATCTTTGKVSAGGDALNRISLRVLVTGGTSNKSALTIDMKGSTLFTELTSLGFLNKFVGGAGQTITVPLKLTLSPLAEQATEFDVTYKAVKNRQGLGQKR